MGRAHNKETLMRYSKEKLVEHCMMLEQDNAAFVERFEIQYANCMKIIDDMKALNTVLASVKRGRGA